VSALTDDAVLAFAETFSDQVGSDAIFDVLVDVAAAYVRLCQSENRPDPERPETFTFATLMGIDYKEACVLGLKENLNMVADL